MYYVYLLSYPENLVPFYVGVGKINRCAACPREYQHILDAKRLVEGKRLYKPNLHKLRTIIKIWNMNQNPLITRVANFDTEIQAFEEEIRLIKHYGRADLGLGPLTNLTDGREGGVNPSPITRKKISDKLKGRQSHLKGKKLGTYSAVRRANISKSLKGKRKNLTQSWKPGNIPWNKGLTKDTHPSVAKYSVPNPKKGWQKGRIPDNLGKAYVKDSEGNTLCVDKDDPRLISGEFTSIFAGRLGHNKGKSLPTKGKSYEELYGPEKAAELRLKRTLSNKKRWENKRNKSN
jgi:hypothetical protein